jgi:hypothetical protein
MIEPYRPPTNTMARVGGIVSISGWVLAWIPVLGIPIGVIREYWRLSLALSVCRDYLLTMTRGRGWLLPV